MSQIFVDSNVTSGVVKQLVLRCVSDPAGKNRAGIFVTVVLLTKRTRFARRQGSQGPCNFAGAEPSSSYLCALALVGVYPALGPVVAKTALFGSLLSHCYSLFLSGGPSRFSELRQAPGKSAVVIFACSFFSHCFFPFGRPRDRLEPYGFSMAGAGRRGIR